jgi:hypothetical protein
MYTILCYFATVGVGEQNCSDGPAERFYSEEMDRDLRNSLEAIANLVYLIRHSLHDPAAAIAYVDLAEERLRAVTVHFGLGPCASQPSVR